MSSSSQVTLESCSPWYPGNLGLIHVASPSLGRLPLQPSHCRTPNRESGSSAGSTRAWWLGQLGKSRWVTGKVLDSWLIDDHVRHVHVMFIENREG